MHYLFFYIFTSFLPTAYLFKKIMIHHISLINYQFHFSQSILNNFLFKFLSKNSLYNIICMPPGQHGGEGAGADIPPQRPQG